MAFACEWDNHQNSILQQNLEFHFKNFAITGYWTQDLLIRKLFLFPVDQFHMAHDYIVNSLLFITRFFLGVGENTVAPIISQKHCVDQKTLCNM